MSRLKMLRPRLTALDTSRVEPPKRISDPHYSTSEHVQWRREVISRADGRCQKCGRTDVRLFADHIVEINDGGDRLDLSNGRALCGSCHTTKTIAERTRRWKERFETVEDSEG
jgi:5-methylcytosine-specific restriction enzyme A